MNGDEIRAGVRRLFRLDVPRPGESAADADQELEAMIEEEVRHLVARGSSPADARAAAMARLGDRPAQARDRVRQSSTQRDRRARWREWIGDAVADGRRAARSLRKSPGLATAAIVTLALAIGANTSIFSAVNAVLLRPLPFADPDRLVALWEENPDFGWYQQDAAPANMMDWREQAGVFSDVGGYASFMEASTLTGRGEPVLLRDQRVTGNFFAVLGVRPALGRVFRDEETWQTEGIAAVILSDRAWRERFGADPAIVGQTIQLSGQAVEVVGVLPRDFVIPGTDPDLWRPMGWPAAARSQTWFRRAHWIRVVGRLAPGATPESANAGLQVVVSRLQRDYPETNTRMGAGLTPLHEFLVGKTRLPLLVLLGAVGVLLLIACANVANLLLVRAAGREREVALRLALGAGRGRLIRQSLAESAVLTGLGGAAGLALGVWGTRILTALQPAGLLPVSGIATSWTVLGYGLAVTAGCAIVFGLAPIWWGDRRAPGDALRDESRTTSGTTRSRRFGDGLLVTQVGLALALTLGAGLLARSYVQLQRVEPGFDPRRVLTVSIALPGTRYDSTAKVVEFYSRLRRETASQPGVVATAIVSKVPLGPASWTSEFAIDGREPIAPGTEILHREIGGDYLGVMRVPLLAGRMLTDLDRSDAPLVAVVNQAFARTHFPGGDPIGSRITFDRTPDSTSAWRTIVGVIGDERQSSLSLPARPEVFTTVDQEPRNAMILVARTEGPPTPLGPAIRRIVAEIDPALALTAIRTMEDVRGLSLARDRFLAILVSTFAVVGLILGLVGTYGVVAQLVQRRHRELGIRIALGARAGQVRWLVLRHGVSLALIGVVIGLTAALAATGAIRSLLYDVAPVDPITFVTVPTLVLLTAAAASWIPALRASRAAPSEVLRSD
ncbi:MAG: ABC transporter permease [Gemmatimonadales bacterium]|nr:ABC transporter permease [Gemmatimonadales bacterium]